MADGFLANKRVFRKNDDPETVVFIKIKFWIIAEIMKRHIEFPF